MNKIKSVIAFLMILTLAFAAAACGDDTPKEPASSNDETQTEGNEPQAGDEGEPGEEPAEIDGEPQQSSGTYVGQIDNNSIEIQTNDGPQAFRIDQTIAEVLSELEMDDPVQFEYFERTIQLDSETVTQLILTRLEKAAAPQAEGNSNGLPKTKEITYEIEGMDETREAALNEGNGYSLYVMNNFKFTKEEPGRDVLYFENDAHYFVRIEKLDGSTLTIDELRELADTELQDIGEVLELEGTDVAEPMRNAALFMRASNAEITKDIIIKEYDGVRFRFTMFLPMGEVTEGFVPTAYAMMNSIVIP